MQGPDGVNGATTGSLRCASREVVRALSYLSRSFVSAATAAATRERRAQSFVVAADVKRPIVRQCRAKSQQGRHANLPSQPHLPLPGCSSAVALATPDLDDLPTIVTLGALPFRQVRPLSLAHNPSAFPRTPHYSQLAIRVLIQPLSPLYPFLSPHELS